MFGKLLKNDLKAQWHSVSTLYLCALITAAAAECFALFSSSKVWAGLAGVLVMLALFITTVVTLIAIAVMFNNTVFGRAGYLTLMLPVKIKSLVLSKSLSNLIWLFCTQVLFIGSVFLWFHQVKDLAGDATASSLESMLKLFGVPSFFTVFVGVIVVCITFLASLALLVQCIEIAISLANVRPLSRLGAFGGIMMFFVIFGILEWLSAKIGGLSHFGIVIQSVSSGATVRFSNSITSSDVFVSGAMQVRLTGTILRLLEAVALHFPIVWIIKNKINVK